VDATLKRVVALIGEADVETRCAALLVLSHLGAADAAVVRAVAAALGGKNAVVRDFAISYLERVRPRDGEQLQRRHAAPHPANYFTIKAAAMAT
jgi:hypothetical protein